MIQVVLCIIIVPGLTYKEPPQFTNSLRAWREVTRAGWPWGYGHRGQPSKARFSSPFRVRSQIPPVLTKKTLAMNWPVAGALAVSSWEGSKHWWPYWFWVNLLILNNRQTYPKAIWPPMFAGMRGHKLICVLFLPLTGTYMTALTMIIDLHLGRI